MQRETTIASKITIRSDRVVGGSSRERGASLDTLGFNMRFITERRPDLAIEIFQLWKAASRLKPEDPLAHEEDFRAAQAELAN